MGDAHAEHAPEGLVDPAVAWATLGAHVVTTRDARGACGGGGVSVRSLHELNHDIMNDFAASVAGPERGPVIAHSDR